MRLFALPYILMLFMSHSSAFAQDVSSACQRAWPGSFKDREAAVAALAASGSEATVPVLEALAAGNLACPQVRSKSFHYLGKRRRCSR